MAHRDQLAQEIDDACCRGDIATVTAMLDAAVRVGDLDRVRAMLDADPSLVHAASPWSPLHTAARAGRVEIIRLLLARGAAVDTANDKGNTPLWFACQSSANAEDRIAVATLLIDAGAPLQRGGEDGSTALHMAAWRGPIAMVELLLCRGAREWLGDAAGKLPRDYAARGVAIDREAIAELLTRPVIRDANFKAAVAAIHAGDVATLRRLLAEHPNLPRDAAVEPECYPPGYFGNPKLLWFVANNPTLIPTMPDNMVNIANAIIDAGVDQHDLNYTLGLVMTSDTALTQRLQRPLMELLLMRGATATPDDLQGTLGHQQIEPVLALLEAGLPLTAPLAAGLGRVDDLARLLPSASTAELHAGLSLAVINRQLEAARLCLAAGADVNAPLIVHTHSLPAHQSAVNDDVPMLRLLVEHGARLDVLDTLWHAAPLGWAIHTKQPAAEAYLRSLAT